MFCSGVNTAEEDQLLAELFKGSQGPPQGIINDLPGVLSVRSPAEAAADASKLDQTSAPASADQAPAAAAGKPLYHRAVVTSMPMPATTRAAAGDVQDDDTSSQATMPMPARKRGRSDEDDEACSSPNDLVEVPAAQTAAARKRQHTAAGPSSQHDASSSRRDQSGTTSGAVNGNAAAAASPDVHKGILVAKVLTKSDANSKRVILPRIAVETNLPQLNAAPHFHFTATDPKGAAWPLVIKAWANGSNPKPVYVMEMIGDVLKQYKLTIGDAVALLADEEGRFYLEWNTEGARAAAARPTYSGIVFKSSGSSSSAEAAAEAEPKPETPTAASAGVPVKQEPQQLQQQQPAAAPVRSPFATAEEFAAAQAAAAAAAATSAPPFPIKQEQQQMAVPAAAPVSSAAVAAAVPGPVTASQQQQLFQQLPASANMPLMTAIPVTSPQVGFVLAPIGVCCCAGSVASMLAAAGLVHVLVGFCAPVFLVLCAANVSCLTSLLFCLLCLLFPPPA